MPKSALSRCLRAVLTRSAEALCDDCADAYRFAEAVTANKDTTALRERIRARHRDDRAVERAPGYATSRAVRIDV
jgi:hypothetical protein